MVDKSADRLCWISVLCAATTVALLSMEGLLQPEFAQSCHLWSIRLTMAAIFALSCGFIAIERFGLVRKETLLDLGIAFHISSPFRF